MRRQDSGFTLVEVGVIVPVLMILAITLFSFMASELLAADKEQTRLAQVYSQSNALGRVEADIRLASGFMPNRASFVTDPYEPTSGWSFQGSGPNRTLLLREYSTTTNPLTSVRSPVYIMANGAPDCSTAANVSKPLAYELIYFVQGTTLYRRTLIDTTAVTCPLQTQYQKLSCPSLTQLQSPSRDPSCGADDEVVATGVTGLAITYYPDGGTTSSLDVYSTPGLLGAALSASITITSTSPSYNGPITTSTTLRMTTQNYQTGGA